MSDKYYLKYKELMRTGLKTKEELILFVLRLYDSVTALGAIFNIDDFTITYIEQELNIKKELTARLKKHKIMKELLK